MLITNVMRNDFRTIHFSYSRWCRVGFVSNVTLRKASENINQFAFYGTRCVIFTLVKHEFSILLYNNNNNNNLLSLSFHVHKSVLIRTYLRVTKLALLSALFVSNIVDGFYV